MNNDNSKKITFYIIGLLIMVGLILFIIKGVKDMVTDQFAENTTEATTEATTDFKDQIKAAHITEATTETTTEATTEATTELTTEEIVEETTQELTVADDTASPFFLSLPQNMSIKKGSTFYILDYVSYIDDVDRAPELTVDGEVNTSEVGSYPLTLTLTDDAGHTTNGRMTVRVLEEYSGGESSGESTARPKEDFETFKATYKNDSTSLGIDVSRWQETIDFNKVKEAGCDFVIIRIGGFDDGSQYTDRYFAENIAGAKAAGLKVGIYWHAEENSPEQVKENVDYMMTALGGESLDFPIAYDWEDFAHFPKYAMNIHDINNCFETFYNAVHAYGYDACLYSSKNFLENVWTNEKGHYVWLANYVSSTSYAGSYYMWQQANTGTIPGVNGDVDFNVLYLDRFESEPGNNTSSPY